MNINDKINGLIQKYYQGESSPDEEKLLRELLKNDESYEYLIEKQLIGFYETQLKNNELNDDFDLRLIDTISNNDNSMPMVNKIIRFMNKSRFYITSAAAVLLVSFFSYWYYNAPSNQASNIITNENFEVNKQVAIHETQKAFKLISENMNKANSSIMKLKYINKFADNQNINNN
jgi:hypothetical protein